MRLAPHSLPDFLARPTRWAALMKRIEKLQPSFESERHQFELACNYANNEPRDKKPHDLGESSTEGL